MRKEPRRLHVEEFKIGCTRHEACVIYARETKFWTKQQEPENRFYRESERITEEDRAVTITPCPIGE